MIINTELDEDYVKLKEFLFSFDFGYKEVLLDQMQHAIVDKQKSEYSLVFRFYVDTFCKPLPDSLCGMPVAIDVVFENDHTCCELFVAHRYVMEYRLYNINCSKLNLENFWKGTAHYEKIV